jgi:formate hydrogenlyase subunit 4
MIFIWILQLILIPLVSPLCIGIIKKIKARFQNREGASVLQPYRDLWKLLHKDEIISRDASWIFKHAPFIVFTITIVVGINIPLFASFIKNAYVGDMLLVVYALSIGTFFLALAGMDTGSAFGGFGSSREMTIAALAEGGFVFSLLTVALLSGSTNLFAISSTGMFVASHSLLPVILAFCGFFIVLLAETSRFPFDNPSTHLELTMIHEAMILEYSGKRLALMEWTAANRLFIFASLASNLFFPWGMAQSAGIGVIMMAIFISLLKVFVICIVIAVIESSMAKYRFFRLPEVLMVAFIINAIAIGIIY